MNTNKKINYDKLRPDVIERLINERGIVRNNTRADAIRKLKLYDDDKYIVETTYEKHEKTKFLVGIDARNWRELSEMGVLVERGNAKKLNYYSDDRLFYSSDIRLSQT